MENKIPLVTICMPTYNHGAYIAVAIQSIIDQNYPNLQIIIADDCSTDNTKDIINKFQRDYPAIIDAHFQPKNVGAELNVQSIYPLIKGDYICWFSGDDYFLPNKIMTQINVMLDNPDCIFSFHSVNVVDIEGKYLYEYNNNVNGSALYLDNIAANLLRHRCFICTNSLMINAKLAADIKHRTDIGIGNDWMLVVELANNGKCIYIPKALGTYRRHNANISKNIKISHEENVYNYILKRYPCYRGDIQCGLVQLYTMYIFKYLLRANVKMTLYCLVKLVMSLYKDPRNIFIVIRKISNEFHKRIYLFKVTGSLER